MACLSLVIIPSSDVLKPTGPKASFLKHNLILVYTIKELKEYLMMNMDQALGANNGTRRVCMLGDGGGSVTKYNKAMGWIL